MLYDRLSWHYDENVRWNDPDAARSYVRLSDDAPETAMPSLWVPDGGYQVHATDHSEWQEPDPQFIPPPGLRGMIARTSDGAHLDPSFSARFRAMDEMLQRGELDYCMWYHLPSPNVTRQQALNGIAVLLRDSGVQWGRPGHGFSIDDEPTPYHDALNGQPMVDLRNALQDIYQREDLHYTGLYSANYHYIPELGWPLWGPWPLSNGNMPSWTANLVMQQWGVADPGGAPGFPNRPVDVNHLFDAAVLDRLTGRTATDDWSAIMADPALAAQLAEFLRQFGPGGPYYLADVYNNAAADHPMTEALYHHVTDANRLLLMSAQLANVEQTTSATKWQVGNMEVVAGTEDQTIASRVQRIDRALGQLATGGIDVAALAEALAPKLGVDPKAIALAVAEVLGERLAAGGTPSGST